MNRIISHLQKTHGARQKLNLLLYIDMVFISIYIKKMKWLAIIVLLSIMFSIFVEQIAGFDTVKIGFPARLVKQFYSSLSLNKTGSDVLIFFKRAVRLEALLMLVLLFCAALLRHEIPARHAMHGDHTGAPLHEHMRH